MHGCALGFLALVGGVYSYHAIAQTSPDYVQFKIEPSEMPRDTSGETAWKASFGAGAKFIISLNIDAYARESSFVFSKGSFRHVPGSDSRALLKSLSIALGAKGVPSPRKRVETLPFEVAIEGTKETRLEGGGFSNRPPGDWIVTKIFLANGEGEVYLNVDPVAGVGEFALKDEEYGDIVLQELASVL